MPRSDSETLRAGHRLTGRVAIAVFTAMNAAAALHSNAARAADSAQAQASVDSGGASLEEVVVTAQKIQEDLQKVPISITALSPDELHAHGVSSTADLEGLLPGVEFQPIGVLFANIRGVGTFNLQPGVDSAVTYAVDGNYIAQAAATPPLLFDLERVEALRGPQGTLFGRNSNAGAINLVTAAPVDRFEAMGSITGGNYSSVATEGMVNVPVSQDFLVRASFATDQHQPYLEDGHNDERDRAGRLRFLATPTSALSILATVDYSSQDSNNNGASPCPPGSAGPCIGQPWRPFLGNPAITPTHDFSQTRNFGAYAEVNYAFDWATLTYIPNYREVHYDSLATPSYPSFGIDEHDHLHTEELRLSSLKSSPVAWVVGLYYSDENLKEHETFVFPTSFGIPGVDGVANFFELDPYDSESKAAFGQVTYPIMSAVRLTGGLRYTDEEKTSAGTANAYGGSVAAPVLISSPTGARELHSGVTWKAGIEADVAANSLAYATVSTGYKSGGINQVTPGIGLPGSYGPETITAYEVGSKNRFINDRLQINAEAFHYDYKGFQTLSAAFEPSGLLFFLTENSQRATFNGGEFEAIAAVTQSDQVTLSGTVLDAHYTRFEVGGVDYSGFRATNAPTYTATVGYQHVFTLTDGARVTAAGDFHQVGPQWTNADHGAGTLQSAYHMSSAELAYSRPNSTWTVSAWIRNIENTGAVYDVNDSPQPAMGFVLPPRTFGLSLRFQVQ
jgi:iron complex outermembrane receptor protein